MNYKNEFILIVKSTKENMPYENHPKILYYNYLKNYIIESLTYYSGYTNKDIKKLTKYINSLTKKEFYRIYTNTLI